MPTPSIGPFLQLQYVLLNKKILVIVILISTGKSGAVVVLTFLVAIQVTYSLEYLGPYSLRLERACQKFETESCK